MCKSNSELFNVTYQRVSQSSNYLLVANGVILAALIAVSLQDLAALRTTNLVWLVSIAILSSFLSSGFCIGGFNAGIFTAINRNRESEYERREKALMISYQTAVILFGFSLIGLSSLFAEKLFPNAWYSVSVVLFSIYLILIFIFGMFNQFTDFKHPLLHSLLNSPFRWPMPMFVMGIVILLVLLTGAMAFIQALFDENQTVMAFSLIFVIVIVSLCIATVPTLNQSSQAR